MPPWRYLAVFEAQLEANLERGLHRELKEGTYQPQAVLQRLIPKAGQPGKHRSKGTIYAYVGLKGAGDLARPWFCRHSY